MTWNLTRKTPPEELAALNDEVVHQRRIGTAIELGASVCDQTGVQCSTSASGEGVTCPLCRAEVDRWFAKRREKEERRENSRQGKNRRQREEHRRRVREQGYVAISHMLPPDVARDLDLLADAGHARSRRHAFALALREWIDARLPDLAKAKTAKVAREAALETAASALRFAGETPGASSPSRHATELKKKLLAIQRRLASDPDLPSGLPSK